MKSIFLRLIKSESPFDDFCGILRGVIFYKARFFRSNKVFFKNQGELQISGRFFMGTFTNRNGLNPIAAGVLRIYKKGQLIVDGNVRIARDCKVYVGGKLYIGSNTFVNPNSMILAHNDVHIGANCAISWNCEIMDSDLHVLIKNGSEQISSKPIVIEDNVWVGTGVKILKGVTIGKGSVIAAGSVVTKSIDSHSLYGGNPARKISENINWKN